MDAQYSSVKVKIGKSERLSAARNTRPPRVSINSSGLADTPAAEDQIGFSPYVRALAHFLTNKKTRPPLTISVEGPWGVGKSSFMLQLEREIRDSSKSNANSNVYCVRFNAWRNEKDEQLWVAFALTFIKQLSNEISLYRKIISNVGLLWKRVDWQAGKMQLILLATYVILLIAITTLFIYHPQQFLAPKSAPKLTTLLGLTWLGALWQAAKKTRTIVGNPLSHELGKLIRRPDYKSKLAFIERFHEDFSKIVNNYLGNDGRAYIFIDDLDRCEIPRAADLMQAINLLLGTEHTNLFFILGIDRELVAAGLAAKHEKILPYLAAGSSQPDINTAMIGIQYGYSFLEKFIQIPFRVPTVQQGQLDPWISAMSGSAGAEANVSKPDRPLHKFSYSTLSGKDPDGFDEIVKTIGKMFDFNPRRMKQFVNVFRLRVMISLSTNTLSQIGPDSRRSAKDTGFRLEQLGLFTALTLRWPRLVGALLQNPDLITHLCDPHIEHDSNKSEKHWANDPHFLEAIRREDTYSLAGVDLRPLLVAMPAIYSANAPPAQKQRELRTHLK